jgi:aryl-alcohol dehydrogenase-like predicted oxidoreductase
MCIDAGVNLIDTADVYSSGASEEIIGEILGGVRKNGTLIATKARFPMGDGPNDAGNSRHHLISACEASLKRMKTDVIDLYQVHEWDGQTPLEETMEALDTLVRQGKVRYIGCSNFSGWHIMKALGISERRQARTLRQPADPLHAGSPRRRIRAAALSASTRASACSSGARSPVACLSGKHRRNQAAPEGTRQFAGWTEPPIRDENRLWNIVDDTGIDCRKPQRLGSPGGARLADRPQGPVTSVIIGGRTEAQFKDNLAAADLKLSDEERKRLDDVSLPQLLYPYWHQRNTASDRLGEADLAARPAPGRK